VSPDSAPAPQAEGPNPVHMRSGPATNWTTVNFGEAIQGVQTPLSWSLWNLGMEYGTRRAFGAMGVFATREVPVPDSPDERMSGIFFGRAAGNVGVFHLIGDRMPGSSGNVIEEKLFGGAVDPEATKPLSMYASYPRVMVKLPRAVWKSGRELPGILEDYRGWWRRSVWDSPPTELSAAQALMSESARRFADVGVPHTVVSMVGPQLLETLADLAEQATGDRSVGMELATGFGGMEETQIISDLWSASRGELELAEIQRRHGFHGPDEGQLDTRSWREDPAPIEAIINGYANRQIADPREMERERIALRERAQERVLAGLPAARRPQAKLAMKLASIYIPARELGKASFLHALDCARCAARAAGAMLVDRGLLEDPEDAFFLTVEEFTGEPHGGFAELTAERKANHGRYERSELPQKWRGQPISIEIDDSAENGGGEVGSGLSGVGVVGERVTGRARVISDPAAAEFEPGDILVCHTTDPSWTPLFMLADALVIDVGGEMSHGAIVARELGVTCVINTVTGTRDIPDGATITVDGRSGTVEIDA
jgi:phosphohistidine swiveling domain-containing protein